MTKTVITNAQIISRGKITLGKDVVVCDGKISDVVPQGSVFGNTVDAKGNYLSSGFVDIHVHGGGGADFMDGVSAYEAACNTHAMHGTTSIVPTLLSADRQETLFAIKQYLQAKRRCKITNNLLGIHLEGPYLSPAMAGAMLPSQLRNPSEAEYMQLFDAAEGQLLRWTAAPELDGALRFGKEMSKRGVVMSIGHSNADIDVVRQACENGYSLVTHLYSACSSITRIGGFRHCGIVEAAYLLDDLNVEIIADGCHLPYELLQFVTKFKKTNKVSLITDAMRAAGQNVTQSFLGSATSPQPVIIEDGVAKLVDRTAFGGSIATCDRLVRTMVLSGARLETAVQMMTENPINAVCPNLKKGKVQKGYDADLVIFDENVNVKKVMVGGTWIK